MEPNLQNKARRKSSKITVGPWTSARAPPGLKIGLAFRPFLRPPTAASILWAHEWFVEGAAWTERAYVTDYHA